VSQYVVFVVGSDLYGVDIDCVQSIERLLPITPLPHVHRAVRGVVNLRGSVVPVVDLNVLFRDAETVPSAQARLMVVQVEDISMGLLVDAAKGVVTIATDRIQAVSEVLQGHRAEFLKGVAITEEHGVLALVHTPALLRIGSASHHPDPAGPIGRPA
jgi:purine-binding chemotaxis protein CheW